MARITHLPVAQGRGEESNMAKESSELGAVARRRGEALLRQRFANLEAQLSAEADSVRAALRARLEAKTPVQKLREDLRGARGECARWEARERELSSQVREWNERVDEQLEALTIAMDRAVQAKQADLRVREQALVEELWVAGLPSDLRDLLARVPTAEAMVAGLRRSVRGPELPAA